MRKSQLFWLLCLGGSSACGTLEGGASSAPQSAASLPPVHVEVPVGEPPALLDAEAPVVRIEVVDAGPRAVVVPYLYGYPLFAGEGAVHGLRRFRQDNWEGYNRQEETDSDGIVRLKETFPRVGCVFTGVLEDEDTYVPMHVLCDLPAPKALGGRKRPVVGQVMVRQSAAKLLEDEVLDRAFHGDFHVTTPDFGQGSGTGYFNTDHGQLGFGFAKGRLDSVAFLFDPPVDAWRRAELWQAPQ